MTNNRKLNKDVTEAPIQNELKSGYVDYDIVISSINKRNESSFFRRLQSLYLRRIKRIDIDQELKVSVFIASGAHIDEKIEKINRRLEKHHK